MEYRVEKFAEPHFFFQDLLPSILKLVVTTNDKGPHLVVHMEQQVDAGAVAAVHQWTMVIVNVSDRTGDPRDGFFRRFHVSGSAR